MIATECAAPPEHFDIELMVAIATAGTEYPLIVWCSPETPRERSYRDRWGIDWPCAAVDLVRLELGVLWLRADQAAAITYDLINSTINGEH